MILQEFVPKSNTQDFSAINLCGHEVIEVMNLVKMRSLRLVLIQSDVYFSEREYWTQRFTYEAGSTKRRKPVASQEVEPGMDLS